MGYLDKSTITVDAILTNRGRELLADSNAGNFKITKFALADDEVDYGLYTTAHPLGSNYYGAIIENMPVLEATPDETQALRYKLVTITEDSISEFGTAVIPQIRTGTAGVEEGGTINLTFSLQDGEGQVLLEPVTSYTTTNSSKETIYTLQLADSTLADVFVSATPSATQTRAAPNSRGSITANGLFFTIKAKNKTGKTAVSVFGQESGAVVTFTISTTAAS